MSVRAAPGYGSLSFAWTRNSSPIDLGDPRVSVTALPDGLSSTLTILNPVSADSGVYAAGVTNACGGVTSQSAAVSIGASCNLADITGIGGPPNPPDGALTIDDFLAFLGAFSDGCAVVTIPCSLADITGIGGPPNPPDGALTIDDFLAFLSAFSDGCP